MKKFKNFTQIKNLCAYKLYMNENNLSYYPDSIFIKDGKVTTQSVEKNRQTENNATSKQSSNTPPINLLMSLLGGNNKNMADLLPLLLAKNSGNNNLNQEQLSAMMKNFQNQTENTTEETKKFQKSTIEEL